MNCEKYQCRGYDVEVISNAKECRTLGDDVNPALFNTRDRCEDIVALIPADP